MMIYFIGYIIFVVINVVATKVVYKAVTVKDLGESLAWGLTSWIGVGVLTLIGIIAGINAFLDSDFQNKRIL